MDDRRADPGALPDAVSLRDYLALQFACSIYANESHTGVPANVISGWAYKRADGMMAAREKSRPTDVVLASSSPTAEPADLASARQEGFEAGLKAAADIVLPTFGDPNEHVRHALRLAILALSPRKDRPHDHP